MPWPLKPKAAGGLVAASPFDLPGVGRIIANIIEPGETVVPS